MLSFVKQQVATAKADVAKAKARRDKHDVGTDAWNAFNNDLIACRNVLAIALGGGTSAALPNLLNVNKAGAEMSLDVVRES